MILDLNTFKNNSIINPESTSTATPSVIETFDKHVIHLSKKAKREILHRKIIDITIDLSLVPIILNYSSAKIKRNFGHGLIHLKKQTNNEFIIRDNSGNKNNDGDSYHAPGDNEHIHKETRTSSNDMPRKELYGTSGKKVNSRPHSIASLLNIKGGDISCCLMNTFLSSPTKAQCAKYPCRQQEAGLET
jgi:hypothetical protein